MQDKVLLPMSQELDIETTFIEAVDNEDKAVVELLKNNISQNTLGNVLENAVQKGQIEIVEIIINAIEKYSCSERCLELAAGQNNVPMVELLVKYKTDRSGLMAFIEAINHRYVGVVRALMPYINIVENNFIALNSAIWSGNEEIIDLLIPYYKKELNCRALVTACATRNINLVMKLLDGGDNCYAEALLVAARVNFKEGVDVLYNLVNVEEMLKEVNVKNCLNTKGADYLIEKIRADACKKELRIEVGRGKVGRDFKI